MVAEEYLKQGVVCARELGERRDVSQWNLQLGEWTVAAIGVGNGRKGARGGSGGISSR